MTRASGIIRVALIGATTAMLWLSPVAAAEQTLPGVDQVKLPLQLGDLRLQLILLGRPCLRQQLLVCIDFAPDRRAHCGELSCN